MRNKFCTERNLFKISIIEDSEIHREWLKTELLEHPTLTVVSANRFGREGIESVRQHNSDLVILDFQLPDMTGLEVARRIKSYNKNAKIFALTAHNDASIVERIINSKYIDAVAIKGSPYLEINFLPALIHVINDGTYLDPSLLDQLREAKNINGLNNLTQREFEVFVQSSSGKSDDKIALDLCVELSHVRNLKSRIARKIKNEKVNNIILKLLTNSYQPIS